jgi:hypothetical protein
MGQDQSTSMAYCRDIFAKNPAAAHSCSDLNHSITDWSLPVVCKPYSTGLPTASETLANVGPIDWRRAVNNRSSKCTLTRSIGYCDNCPPLLSIPLDEGPRTKLIANAPEVLGLNLRFFRDSRRGKCCDGRRIETSTQGEMQVDTIGELSITELDKIGLTLDLPCLQLQH